LRAAAGGMIIVGDRSPDQEASMAKELRCSDLMPGCQFVASGANEDEVMTKAAEHAKTAHGLSSIPPDVAQKAQASIRESR
jgi:predicted small metal-binding protein